MSIAASVGETAAGSARSAWAGVSCSAQGAPAQCARGGWAVRRRRLPARCGETDGRGESRDHQRLGKCCCEAHL